MIRDGPYGLYSATPPGKSTDRDRVIAPSGQNRSNGGHALHRALGRGADLAGVGQVAAVQERGFYWTRFAAEGSPNGPTAPRWSRYAPATASVHVSNILGKLGMSSRAEIAAWAVRQGLRPV